MMPKVSVIIINYNKEKYIKQCIDSVLRQSLKEIEIIVVDDGSTDKSLAIIQEYADTYENVCLISQENAGPGVARNKGLSFANGEYVTFLDADDYIKSKAYEQLYHYVTQQMADIIIGNITCFNDFKEWQLPYMKQVFNTNLPTLRTVTDNKEIHLTPSVCNKLFKRSLLKDNQIEFLANIRVGEDLFFTQKCYYYAKKIMVKDIDMLKYRVQNFGESLSRSVDIGYFFDLALVQREILQFYKEKNILKMILEVEKRQVAFFIRSFFSKGKYLDLLQIDELIEATLTFIETIHHKEIFSEIKDEYKLFILLVKQKEGKNLCRLLTIVNDDEISREHYIENGRYYSYLYKYFPIGKDSLLINDFQIKHKIEIIKLRGSLLTLGGYAFIECLNTIGLKKEIVFKHGEKRVVVPLENQLRTDVSYLMSSNTIDYNQAGFKTITVDVLNDLAEGEWDVFIKIASNSIRLEAKVEVVLAQLRNNTKVSIQHGIGIIPMYKKQKYLSLQRKKLNIFGEIKTRLSQLKRNVRYDLSFLRSKDYSTYFIIFIYKVFGNLLRRRKIWIIGERRDTAQDNSFHLFRYMMKQKVRQNSYYVIEKKSQDYKNLKQYRNILEFGSFKHTLYMLVADKTINSYLETANMYTSSYKKIIKYYPEWQRNKKIFIQHGVIGVSRVNHALHKNRTDFSLFVVSSEFEKEHIVKEFGFDDHEVVVTGLPRWDALDDTSKRNNHILLMPTWRSWIKSREQLQESKYMQTYISFLENENLHRILEERNISLTFFPHYQTQKLIGDLPDFHSQINIVKQGERTVQELLKGHSLLITDYSTVAFDFIYMNKSVIFYQFDYSDFYSKHYNKGPIDEENDLFYERIEQEKELLKLLKTNRYPEFSSIKSKYICDINGSHSKAIYDILVGAEKNE